METKKYIGEVWVDIIGIYQVSNFGRVRNKVTGRMLKQQKERGGYYRVYLYGKKYLVHRLVAEAFIPNPKHLPCVNHKDENKANNRLSNLEWCTYTYNLNYGTRSQKAIESKSKPVLQQTKTWAVIKEFKSIKEASIETNINRLCIGLCCNGKRETAGGYRWSFKY